MKPRNVNATSRLHDLMENADRFVVMVDIEFCRDLRLKRTIRVAQHLATTDEHARGFYDVPKEWRPHAGKSGFQEYVFTQVDLKTAPLLVNCTEFAKDSDYSTIESARFNHAAVYSGFRLINPVAIHANAKQ
ncbi:hypothetical protein M514_05047 [Trichuris suis]|uniref:Uncharacterized protein n=1 Tax=Trichuris suis TaxID=68888 RepID=A0A085NCU9_9BILA|nr:hypothetical protein M513_05047 [Trichuris suis]KFD67295.1 hypothetical protein M514_05047 [Trichuris suis]